MFSSKKKGSKKPPKATQTTLAGSVDDREPAQINLLDSGAVKRELDEAVARVSLPHEWLSNNAGTVTFTNVSECCCNCCRLQSKLGFRKTILSAM